jgi:hypothetical protein
MVGCRSVFDSDRGFDLLLCTLPTRARCRLRIPVIRAKIIGAWVTSRQPFRLALAIAAAIGVVVGAGITSGIAYVERGKQNW